MKNKSLSKLLMKLQNSDSEGSEIVSLNEELAMKIMGGLPKPNNGCNNGTCLDKTNGGCNNTSCTGTDNVCTNQVCSPS